MLQENKLGVQPAPTLNRPRNSENPEKSKNLYYSLIPLCISRWYGPVLMPPPNVHISIARLWDFARDPKSPTLQTDERDHLWDCEDCTAVLWLCSTLESVDDLWRKLTEHH